MGVLDDKRLTQKARDVISAPRVVVGVSAVNLWEISIKHGLNRGDMPISGKEALHFFTEAGYHLLNIIPEHTIAVEDLATHHHDPFARLLIAQALTELMRLITHDVQVAKYSDTIMHV